jgi:VanZ family protein
MKKLSLWLPVALYCGVIFFLSSQEKLPQIATMLPDKVEHAFLFAGLGWLTARAVSRDFPVLGHGVWIACALFSLAYGLSDEYHQSFVPGRTAEVGDVVADLFGGLAGALAYTTIGRRLWVPKSDTDRPQEDQSLSASDSSLGYPASSDERAKPGKITE